MQYEIRQSKKNGQWRVYLISDNGRKLLWSEQYNNLNDAKDCAKLANGTNMFDVFIIDKDDKIVQ